jgi:glycosyl transferase family 2
MKLVETLLVRDEVDVIDAHLAFHLAAGVDFVLAFDHESSDGTTDVLESYARSGVLERIPKSGPLREIDWRTELARMAAVDHEASWVVNADADQFWWSVHGSLRRALERVPSSYGLVRSFDRAFVPRPDDGRHFAERMTTRLAAQAPLNLPSSAYRPLPRVLHRGDPGIRVSRGSHTVSNSDLRLFPPTSEIEVLHFPWRSAAQMARKAAAMDRAFARGPRQPAEYHAAARRAALSGGGDAHYSAMVVDNPTLAHGLEAGCLAEDTRVRDALRSLADVSPLPPPGGLSFGSRPPGVVTLSDAASDRLRRRLEGALNVEAELVRLQRRLDVVGARLGATQS